MAQLRVAACQVNTVVGDLEGNARRILDALATAEEAGADIAVFPELAVTGYPPEDLLDRPAFVRDNRAVFERIARATGDCAAAVGFVGIDPSGRLTNSAAVCARGRILAEYAKRLLPNYGVFDEQRWFAPGQGEAPRVVVAGVPLGVTVCEDMWFGGGPMRDQAARGARVLVNLNASPYSRGRRLERLSVIHERVSETGCALVYVNQVGGQDELVFDGNSMVVGPDGALLAEAPQFAEAVLVCDLAVDAPRSGAVPGATEAGATGFASPGGERVTSRRSRAVAGGRPPIVHGLVEPLSDCAEVYEALVLGTRDYLRKNAFEDAVVGLSGGIDSSLVATVAMDALGPTHVHGVAMPSRYSSEGSVADAKTLADNLGIDLEIVPIDAIHRAFGAALLPVLGAEPSGLTDENLQSRIRGVLLMGLSNARGWIVLTTGNKSEMATGYSTLYGDSAGGFAVIKDVPKSLVYELCRHRNREAGRPLVPEPVLLKAPSAELRPGQRDEDTLPPYSELDPIVAGYVEGDRSAADLVAEGFAHATVARVIALVDRAEYKRRQMPPGVRISTKAFGKDRRMPITNHYRGLADERGPAVGGARPAPGREVDSRPSEPAHDVALGVQDAAGLRAGAAGLRTGAAGRGTGEADAPELDGGRAEEGLNAGNSGTGGTGGKGGNNGGNSGGEAPDGEHGREVRAAAEIAQGGASIID